MGFLDKMSKTITNKAEKNVTKSVEKGVDKSMDVNAHKKRSEEHKAKKEEQAKKAQEEQAAVAASSGKTDRRKCSCGNITKDNFCGKCGANLSSVDYMTEKELDDHLNS